MAKAYLEARGWSAWELLPTADGWMARRRDPHGDSFIERTGKTVVDALRQIEAFELTLTKGPA